jgi:hypothetical protein
MSLPRQIPNHLLRAEKLPPPDCDWETLGRFALTFDGYRHGGGFQACAEIARDPRHCTLSDLRACLFLQQRCWRHWGEVPDVESMRYLRGLLEEIRQRVRAADERLV